MNAEQIKIQIETKVTENNTTLYRASLAQTMDSWESKWNPSVINAIIDGVGLYVEYMTFDGDGTPLMSATEAAQAAAVRVLELMIQHMEIQLITRKLGN